MEKDEKRRDEGRERNGRDGGRKVKGQREIARDGTGHVMGWEWKERDRRKGRERE